MQNCRDITRTFRVISRMFRVLSRKLRVYRKRFAFYMRKFCVTKRMWGRYKTILKVLNDLRNPISAINKTFLDFKLSLTKKNRRHKKYRIHQFLHNSDGIDFFYFFLQINIRNFWESLIPMNFRYLSCCIGKYRVWK